MHSLRISIPIMFTRIGCQSEEYIKDMGEDFVDQLRDLNDGNIVNYLSVIEKRTNDLL